METKSKLPVNIEVQYLEQLALRAKLVSYACRAVVNDQAQHDMNQIKKNSEFAYSAANSLVLFCQKFASVNPGDETDRYRLSARKVRVVVKQLIYHSLNVNKNPFIQINEIMKCGIELFTNLLPIITKSVKKRAKLTCIYDKISEKQFCTPKKGYASWDEQLTIIFTQVKAFQSGLVAYRNKINKFKETKKSVTPNLNTQISAIFLLCKEKQVELDEMEKYMTAEYQLIEECDELNRNLNSIVQDVRTYIQSLFQNDQVSLLNISTLAIKLRITGSHLLSLLRSNIIETNKDNLSKIMSEPNNYDLNEFFPPRLKNHFLFHLGDKKTRIKILRLQTYQLTESQQMIRQELQQNEESTKIKQSKLQQIKKKESLIMDLQLKRHKREEDWNNIESEELERQSKVLEALTLELDEEEEKLNEIENELALEQLQLDQKKNVLLFGMSENISTERTKSQNLKKSISGQLEKKKAIKKLESPKQLTDTFGRDKEEKKSDKKKEKEEKKQLKIMEKTAGREEKEELALDKSTKEDRKSLPPNRPPPDVPIKRKAVTQAEPLKSSQDGQPGKSSQEESGKAGEDVQKIESQQRVLNSLFNKMMETDKSEEYNQIIQSELKLIHENYSKLIEKQTDYMKIRKIFDQRKEKLLKLTEQFDFRKKHFENNFRRSCEAAAMATASLLKSIKQEQIATLQELREYHQKELNLKKLSEDLQKQLRSYRDFLQHQVSVNSKNEKKVDKDNIEEQIAATLLSFSSSLRLLLENIVLSTQNQHQQSSVDDYSINIWNEPFIANGNMKTVILSTDNTENEENAQQIELTSRNIKAGTLNQLVMRLTDEKRHALNFLKTFITTYQSFTTTDLFFQKLVERYNVPHEKHTDIPEEQWKQNIVIPIQVRVYNVIKLWLDTRFPDFDYMLMKKLNHFMDSKLRKDGHSNFANTLASIIKRKIAQEIMLSLRSTSTVRINKLIPLKSDAAHPNDNSHSSSPAAVIPVPLSSSPGQKSPSHPASHPVSVNKSSPQNTAVSIPASPSTNLSATIGQAPNHTPAMDEFILSTSIDCICKSFCLIDSKLYQSIQPVELLNCAWTKAKLKYRSKNVLSLIERFNVLSNWTAYCICSTEKLRQRQLVFTRFVSIAEKLREFNNFNSLLAIIAGINSIAVHRLHFTKEGVPLKSQEAFMELHTLMNANNSYKNYREAIHTSSPPIVPYLGTYLTDLVFIDDGNPDTMEGLINFRKREMVYKVIEEIQQYQQSPYNFEVDQALLDQLTYLPVYEEDDLYQISLTIEPKNCKDRNELVQ